jgi:hypothetical protein
VTTASITTVENAVIEPRFALRVISFSILQQVGMRDLTCSGEG